MSHERASFFYRLPDGIMDFLKHIENENTQSSLSVIDAFQLSFDALEDAGVPHYLLQAAKRELAFFSKGLRKIPNPLMAMKEELDVYDEGLDEALAGFASLFQSAIEEEEIYLEENFEWEALDEETRDRLSVLHATYQVFIFLDAIVEDKRQIASKAAAFFVCELVAQIVDKKQLIEWMQTRTLHFLLKNAFEELCTLSLYLSEQDGLMALSNEDLMRFQQKGVEGVLALWALPVLMQRHCHMIGVLRKTFEDFLSISSMPSLKVFERAGFFERE